MAVVYFWMMNFWKCLLVSHIFYFVWVVSKYDDDYCE